MRHTKKSSNFHATHSFWRSFSTKVIFQKVQFLMYRPKPPSPMLHSLWDDPYGSKIPIDSHFRTPNQHLHMKNVVNKLADGILEILEHASSRKEKDSIGVVTTPEFSLATGVPITEDELQIIITKLIQYLNGKGELLHVHLASFLVHLSPDSKFFDKSINVCTKNPTILNVAIIGKVDANREAMVNIYYKQRVSKGDIFSEYNEKDEINEVEDINLNRVIISDETQTIFVGELCLENKYGVGLVAVAKAIANRAIDSSVDYTAYQGYHLLSSDTIDYVGGHSAFKIFAQNDARNEPTVVIINDDKQQQNRIDVSIESSIQIHSPNPVANGELSIFSPIELQPMRIKTIETAKEIEMEAFSEENGSRFKQ